VIDFDPGDELELLASTARRFAADHLAPSFREAESARRVGSAARSAWDALGLAELEWPESLGGGGLGPLARVVVNEELGAADPGAALALDRLGPVVGALAELGGEDALREHVRPVARDPAARAVLLTPGDARIEIRAGRASGSAAWIPADRVDLVVWLDGDGAAILRDGLECEGVRGAGLRAAGASALTLNDARVVARFPGAEPAARALARARLYAASLLVGVLRQAADFSRAYALERQAFGRPIAHHQALAFLIVDMRSAIDAARLLVQEAAWRLESGLEAGVCASAAGSAFAEAVEASRQVGPASVQILGGHGFMRDYPVEKSMREARALGLWLGGVDAAREDAGRLLAAAGVPVALPVWEGAP